MRSLPFDQPDATFNFARGTSRLSHFARSSDTYLDPLPRHHLASTLRYILVGLIKPHHPTDLLIQSPGTSSIACALSILIHKPTVGSYCIFRYLWCILVLRSQAFFPFLSSTQNNLIVILAPHQLWQLKPVHLL